MGGTTGLKTHISRFGAATRVSDLWRHTVVFMKERGIEMIVYRSDDAQLPGAKSLEVVSHGVPEAWLGEYRRKKLHLVDPIPMIAAVTSRPFKWSETSRLAKLSEEAQEFMRLLEASNIGDGLAMQVYGPNMRNAFVALGFGRPDPGLTQDQIAELQCGIQFAHMCYCRLTERRLRPSATLSPREVEILEWMARGKSNAVIADILGISRHTVDTLARRIYEKLEVNDRTTAVVRGLRDGLVKYRRGVVV